MNLILSETIEHIQIKSVIPVPSRGKQRYISTDCYLITRFFVLKNKGTDTSQSCKSYSTSWHTYYKYGIQHHWGICIQIGHHTALFKFNAQNCYSSVLYCFKSIQTTTENTCISAKYIVISLKSPPYSKYNNIKIK